MATKIRLALVAVLVGLPLSLAYAQTGEIGSSLHSAWTQWLPVLSACLGLLAVFAKRGSLLGKYSYTWYGQAATSFVLGLTGALMPLFDSGAFTWPGSLITALAAAIVATAGQMVVPTTKPAVAPVDPLSK